MILNMASTAIPVARYDSLPRGCRYGIPEIYFQQKFVLFQVNELYFMYKLYTGCTSLCPTLQIYVVYTVSSDNTSATKII